MKTGYKFLISFISILSIMAVAFIFVFQPFNRVIVISESIQAHETKLLSYNKYMVKVKVSLTSVPYYIQVTVLVNGKIVYEDVDNEIYYFDEFGFGKKLVQIVIISYDPTQILGEVWIPLF